MKRRTPLKNQLIESWNACVKYDYANGVINGERALQACLYHRMTKLFEVAEISSRRRIFIEPTIYSQGRTWRRMPDMVVCDTKNVIAIIELKFHPRVTLSGKDGGSLREGVEKDLETLLTVAQDVGAAEEKTPGGAARIVVRNERYLGIGDESKVYGLADNLLLVWAGIYKQSEGDEATSTERLARVFEEKGTVVHGGLLELHARTQNQLQPSCTERYSGWKVPAAVDSEVA